MKTKILVAGVVVALTAGMLGVPGASAGEYHVYSCRTPSGGVAPTDGWSGSVGGAGDTALNTCPDHGGLIAALNAGVTHAANGPVTAWKFKAPDNLTLAGATIWRAGATAGGGNSSVSYLFWLAGSANDGDNVNVFDECAAGRGCAGEGNPATPLDISNRLVAPDAALHTPDLSLTAFCGSPLEENTCPAGPGDSRGYSAVVELFAADLEVQESETPSVSGVAGNLAVAGVVSGSSDLAFDASDVGSGIYEASFEVDGQMVSRKVIGINGGRCEDVGQTTDGLPAFLYAQPCPPSVSVDVPFDTTVIPNGAHHVVVDVSDAAGNATPVLDREITFANAGLAGRGGANGSDPAEQATLTASWRNTPGVHLISNYDKVPELSGKLSDPSGRAIANAAVDVSVDPTYLGARPWVLPAPRTGPDGRWSLRLPRTIGSCAVRLAYRSHLNDTQPVATRTLTLGVRAGLTLHVSPRVTSVGRRIVFHGLLAGSPIPRGGKQVVLEARSPGGPWIEFHVLSTDAHGRFRASYRFRYPGPANYSFRALSRYEADFPFLAGASNLVGVHER